DGGQFAAADGGGQLLHGQVMNLGHASEPYPLGPPEAISAGAVRAATGAGLQVTSPAAGSDYGTGWRQVAGRPPGAGTPEPAAGPQAGAAPRLPARPARGYRRDQRRAPPTSRKPTTAISASTAIQNRKCSAEITAETIRNRAIAASTIRINIPM